MQEGPTWIPVCPLSQLCKNSTPLRTAVRDIVEGINDLYEEVEVKLT